MFATLTAAFSIIQADGDLLAEEFDDIWDQAPKFPDVEEAFDQRVDVDSFVQLYRDIDDLFEAEEESTIAPASVDSAIASITQDDYEDTDEENGSNTDETMEAELENIYQEICDKDNLLTLEKIKQWDEVGKLLEDGLLGEDELQDLWDRTNKAPGSVDRLDLDGFLSFNIELDGLFEFEDQDMQEDNGEEDEDEEAELSVIPNKAMVKGDELSVNALFAMLMGSDGKVGRDELMYWFELKEMLDMGDLLESELDSFFVKAGDGKSRLSEEEFEILSRAIDDLFEDDNAEDYLQSDAGRQTSGILEGELLEALQALEDPDLLPCGLDSDEKEQQEILSIVSDLELLPSNLIRQQGGGIDLETLAGTWDLVYSSSSAMRYNKGISGIGGSFPNGRFAGLKQTLKASKYLRDVEYIERIEVNPSSASFDVKITGTWDVRTSVSLFTGEPSAVLTVLPDMVTYGPTSTRGDHWKSLGPLNMLDITYLSDDLRIMRGNTAVENIFIYRRSLK